MHLYGLGINIYIYIYSGMRSPCTTSRQAHQFSFRPRPAEMECHRKSKAGIGHLGHIETPFSGRARLTEWRELTSVEFSAQATRFTGLQSMVEV